MSAIDSLNIIIEDILSEAVMKRLLAYVKYAGNTTYRCTCGNGKIKANVDKYKAASRVVPHIILTDLDRYLCPSALLAAWGVSNLPPTMLLRIAVREVEAWLLSDRNGIASFLHTAIEKVPFLPETEYDPKQTLFSVVRKSRKRRLVEGMIPQPGAHIGPLYNEYMCDFALNHWQIGAAVKNAPSLTRNISRISAFLQN
ncbi:MAG: hypothetical protein CVU24_16435 [Betaproteobacteria bacterium HGW-Betaproteobacteria-18]|nr:MAG: hypothetical protein CVU68_03790 [Deltaproteobacteria bacterium HGW-Deltaproteobacteria-3]PKO58864.1 MAG: hypothetical protein CVU24_16435 [Betaproteobacteria bacterium HGW-Betaproteobacteria-18]